MMLGLENRGEVEVECEFDAYPSHDDMKTYLRTLTQGRPLDAWVRVFARVVDGPVLGEVLHASRVGNVITWEEYQMPAPPDVSTEG